MNQNPISRYARQEILTEIGSDGQKKLKNSHILVIGAGGLACPALQYLVGAGIGKISLVDNDTISRTNLHRQTLYRESQIGALKAGIAVQSLSELNEDCQLTAIPEALTSANVSALIADADIVLDCADSFAVSYILSDACLAQNKPLFAASALEFSGYVGGFCGGAPSLRAIFPDLPARAATCATAGILGAVVGTIGALQAQMALAHILNLAPSPLGQLVTLDLKQYRFGGFRFDNAPEPVKDILKFTHLSAIKPADFVVELRDEQEAPVAIHTQAIRHTPDEFSRQIPAPQPDQRAILCCHSGLRAWQAARHLQSYWRGEIYLISQTTQ